MTAQIARAPEAEPLVVLTILGEPASKANSRKAATIGGKRMNIGGKEVRVGGKSRFIKSDKARDYEQDALQQIPPAARRQLTGPLAVTMRIYYATERPDLDESLVLDILQDRYRTVKQGNTKRRELVQRGVYCNDRQVREKHVYHAIDKSNPRTVIEIRPLASVPYAPDMFGGQTA